MMPQPAAERRSQAVQRIVGLQWAPPLMAGRLRPVMILGHMRSGSTLLVHILVTNPEIAGYGETHLRYRSPADWLALSARTLRREVTTDGYTWVLDKVLHDYIMSKTILRSRRARWIFLVREPEGALRSLVGLDIVPSSGAAADHYVNSLRRLQEQYTYVRSPKVVVRYEHLVTEPAAVLGSITELLELREPLTPEYDLNWATGRPGIGDPSENIASGRILAVNERRSRDDAIDGADLERASHSYDEFLRAVSDDRHCL